MNLRRRKLTAAAVAAATLASLAAAPASQATNLTYWSGVLGAGDSEGGPRHTIFSNFGQTYAGNQYVVGVFALENDGSPAGSVAYGNGTVSKAYCQCAYRYPYVINAEPYTAMNIVGIESY